MTHDELLAKIKDAETNMCFFIRDVDECEFIHEVYSALRAVVELHKPEHSIRGYRCSFDDEAFPCFHHHLIEKELK